MQNGSKVKIVNFESAYFNEQGVLLRVEDHTRGDYLSHVVKLTTPQAAGLTTQVKFSKNELELVVD